MDWARLLDPQIKNFVDEHENADISALALKKPPAEDWPYRLMLDQISAQRKARVKVPQWLGHPDIVLPSSETMEQASSAATALYKARIVQGESFADLAAGAGVDSWAFARFFSKGICVEKDAAAAALLAHNLRGLGLENLAVLHKAAEDFVPEMPEVDLAYLDPQRRTDTRRGIYRLEEGSPDILKLLPVLEGKARYVMLKASPMLDIDEGLRVLPRTVAVHVLEWRGECREVVYLMERKADIPRHEIPVTAAEINDRGDAMRSLSFSRAQEKACSAAMGKPEEFLYEPGPAFQKAGSFNFTAQAFEVRKLHPHTHLYTSNDYRSGFPGRHFKILGILPVDRKALPFSRANLTIRNFPSTVEALRKRLRLADGGPEYLFACTLADERKVLLRVRKIEDG